MLLARFYALSAAQHASSNVARDSIEVPSGRLDVDVFDASQGSYGAQQRSTAVR
jgi:hypothetical protein